jgi:hypothetical protein
VERSENAVKKMEMIGLRQVSGGIPGHTKPPAKGNSPFCPTSLPPRMRQSSNQQTANELVVA